MPAPAPPDEEVPGPNEAALPEAELTGTSRATTVAFVASAVGWNAAMAASAHHPWLAALVWGSGGVYLLASLIAGVVAWRMGEEKSRALSKRYLNVSMRGRLSVDREGLLMDGVRVLRRSEITRGQVDAREDGRAILVLHRRARLLGRWVGPVSVELPTAEEAHALSRALGTDLASTAMESTAGSPLERLWVFPIGMALLVSIAALVAHDKAAWVNLVPAAACLFALLSTAPLGLTAMLRIGTDGVEYRWLGRRRYVSYRSVVGVHPGYAGVTLDLKDGSHVSWRFPFVRLTIARLEEALEAYRANATDEGALWLARRDRPRVEWVRDLREIGGGGARGYRVSPPSKEALWRMVEDPAADVAVRAASAGALGATLDDAGRQRLRLAAKVTALPELSAVLEREAEADAAAAEEALEVLERKHALSLGA